MALESPNRQTGADEPPVPRARPEFPAAPTSLMDTGISRVLLTQLLVKTLYLAGEVTELSAARRIKLPYSVVRDLLQDLRKEKLCEVRGGADATGMLFRYALTDSGIARAQDYVEVSRYTGPAPVPLVQFEAMVRCQSVLNCSISRQTLEAGLQAIVLPPQVLKQLGSALNSGWPIFLYGDPGNGKTVIAEALGRMLGGEAGGEVLFPHAVEVDDQTIEVFDPAIHEVVELPEPGEGSLGAPQRDSRWVRCRRPTIFTGGELTLAMLDLTFNPISRYYSAPPQVKASGGVLILDDFGRQQVQPQALLNRWIVPLESRVDYLTLHTGKKFRVPFDTLVVFGTNIDPRQLADEAFLRRMRNKIYLANPSRENYTEIFRRCCQKQGIPFDVAAIDYLFKAYYEKHGIPPRASHPRDITEQIVSIAKFFELTPSLDTWFLDRACENYFLLPAVEGSLSSSADVNQG